MAKSIGRITLAAFVLLGSASTAVAQQIKGCVVDNNYKYFCKKTW